MSLLSLTRIALPLLALVLLAVLHYAAQAQTETSVELLAIDADTTGNSATSVGQVDVCAEMDVGQEHNVDVIVRGIPEVPGDGGELAGFQLTVLYDERYVEIIDFDIAGQFLGNLPGSNVIDAFTDPVPNNTGLFLAAAADFGPDAEESGDGVLVRLTLRGVDAGTSNLAFVEDTILQDSRTNSTVTYDIDTMQNAMIAVGVGCAPGATPPPVPDVVPTRTLAPPDEVTGSPGTDESPTDEASPDDVASGTTTPTGRASQSPDPSDDDGDDGNGEDEDDDGGSGGTVIIIVAVVAAILLALAGAGYLALRRREETEA